MNITMPRKGMLTAALVLRMIPVQVNAQDDDEEGGDGLTISGQITPKLYVFDYFEGPGEKQTQFFEQYNFQQGFLGDRRSDFYIDADLNLRIANADRNLFQLERQGFGAYNHRGRAQVDTDQIGVRGFYRHFRSATGGFNYLYNPNAVEGGQIRSTSRPEARTPTRATRPSSITTRIRTSSASTAPPMVPASCSSRPCSGTSSRPPSATTAISARATSSRPMCSGPGTSARRGPTPRSRSGRCSAGGASTRRWTRT